MTIRQSFAPAKVNLFLHVVGQRPDGYHRLDSLVVFAGVGDFLHAAPAKDLRLQVTGPFAATLGAGPDNLVLRAARILDSQKGAKLTLEKRLPVASGIGGGSADAAATLRLLSRMWDVPAASPAQALALGADVPVCLTSAPCRMGGVGEVITPSPALPRFGIALVNPGVEVSTASIFRARQGVFSSPAMLPGGWGSAAALAADLAACRNDLEPPAIALCPAIGDALAKLRATRGCRLARMSGSGATCFALYDSPQEAARAAAQCHRRGWWSWGGELCHEPHLL